MPNLVKNSTIYALGDILPKLFSFITFPILTSYLTPAEYGILNYVNTLNVFLLVFSVLCLNTYYLVYYYRQKNEEERQKLLGNLSVFIVGINVFVSILAYLLGYYFADIFQNEISFYPYIALGIGINFFNVFATLPLATYRVEEHPLPITIINVVKSGLIMLLTVILVVKFEYKALGVLWATLVVTILFAFGFIILTVKKAKICFDWQQIKEALFFSLPLVPGSLAYYLVSMSDRILIERYAGLTELGIYSTASTLALLLNIVSMGAYKAFEPYFFKIYGSDIFLTQFKKIYNAFFFVLLIGVSGLALFSKEFLKIMSSEDFLVSYLYVPILLIGVLASSINLLYGTILTAQGKTKINSFISILGGGCSVILNFMLLPHWGILAACIISAFTFIGMLLVSILCTQVTISHRRISLTLFIAISLMIYPIYFMNIESLVLSILLKFAIFIIIGLIAASLLNFNLKKIYGTIFG